MTGSRPWLQICGRCARTVGSACLTSVCWVVWVLLGVSLVGLAIIYFHREISVPSFLLRRIERKLEFAQLSARFGRTVFDPTGNLVLQDVRVFGAGMAEPLASAGAVRVRMDFWAVAAGGFDVREVEVVDLRLDCPARVSPSGSSEPVVAGLFGTVTRTGDDWDIPQAVFSAGRVLVTARVHWTARRAGRREFPADLLKTYCQLSRRLADALRRTEQMESPRLKLAVSVFPGQPVRTHAELTAGRLEVSVATGDGGGLPTVGGTAEDLVVNADLAWRRGHPATAEVEMAAARVTGPAGLVVERPWLQARGQLESDPWRWTGDPVQFCAGSVARGADRAEAPLGKAELGSLPVVRGEVAALVRGSPVALSATVDMGAGSGEAALEGSFSPRLLNEAAARAAEWRRSQILRRMEFREPVWLRGQVRLGPAWRLVEARAAGHAGAATVSGVDLQDTYAEVVTDGRALRVEPISLVRPGARVHGSYEMEFANQDYRFLLHGRFFPETITPWVGRAWGRFWTDFSFGTTPPLADADIRGRWRTPRFNRFYGWADAPSVTVRGVPLDRLQATFFIRPEHYDILAFDARRGTLGASGGFTRIDDPRGAGGPGRLPQSIAFDVRSTLPLSDGGRLFGEEGRRMVAPYAFEQPPQVEAAGRLWWDGEGAHDDVVAKIAAAGVMRFHEFPVEDPRVSFTMKEGVIDVSQVEAALAGGKLTAKAVVTGPRTARRLAFDVELKGANLDGTAATWRAYREKTAVPGAPPLPPPHPLGKDGTLDLQVQAAGPLDNLFALRGTGTAAVSRAELGGVGLFGPLSVKFNAAKASFAVEEDKLVFSRLRFSGPLAVLEAKGHYTMPTSGLSFGVKLLPFRENSFPVFSLLGMVLEPISMVMEVRLTGTLAKPDWYFLAGPTNLLGLKTPTPPAGAPAVPADPKAAGGAAEQQPAVAPEPLPGNDPEPDPPGRPEAG